VHEIGEVRGCRGCRSRRRDVRKSRGGQANLPKHYARLAGMLVILHRLRLEVNGE
jgi:hypothetical protein